MLSLLEESRAQRELARSARGYVPRVLREDLRALSEGMRVDLEHADLERLEALVDIAREMRACSEQDLRTVDRARVEIHRALGRLRRSPSAAALLASIPGELARSCGFARTILARVDDGHWLPLLPPPGIDGDADRLREALGTAPRVPLRTMQVEAEVVRRKSGQRVADARRDPRCHAASVAALDSTDYIAVPIMPSGTVIGILHADRAGQGVPSSDEDLDNAMVFAEHVGWLVERANFAEELTLRNERLAAAQAAMLARLEELRARPVYLQMADLHADDASDDPNDVPPPDRLALLTPREREVLELIVTGATNQRIARELVLGEETIKTHVGRILRKLRATSRAEAAARYVRIRGVR